MHYVIKHGDVYRESDSKLPGLAHMSGDHICDGSQMMAVVYDTATGTLHKTGRSDQVEAWADNTRKVFIEGGFPEMAEDLVVVSFPPVEETIAELNACIATSGRIRHFQDALEEIGKTRPDLFDRPVYPR